MKRVRCHRLFLASACAATLASGALLAGDPALPASAPAAPVFDPSVKPSASGVTFLTRKTRLWLGRSQIICFYAKQAPEEDRYFSFNADETCLHILIPPTLLPGAHLGYIRVRPIREGTTQLSLDGARLDVEIVRDTAAGTLELTRPEIVSPSRGAVVWGKFVVGVEQLNLSGNAHPPLPALRLPDGREMAAQTMPGQQPGPHLHYAFTVDAAALKPGTNELTPVLREASGHEVIGEPIELTVVDPDPVAILSGDCKDLVNTLPPPPKVAPVLPPGASPKPFVPPAVIADDRGVFGPIVSNPGENPPWRMPLTVPAKGLYQMIVTARGDLGANALPTIGLVIDNAQNPVTTARLATTDWQRIPVGNPFPLEPGGHILSVSFRNGFGSGPTDSRHLYLAKYELVRLDPPGAPMLASNAAGTMTEQAAMPAAPMQETAMQSTTMQGAAMQSATMQETAMQGATMQGAAMQSTAVPPVPMPSPPTPGPVVPSTAMQSQPASATAMQEMAMQARSMGVPMTQDAIPSGSFHIVFRDPLQGRTIAGPVQIGALCWWPDRGHSAPPKVDLLVNGKVAATLSTPQPQFQVPVSAFQPGENKIVLQASLANGRSAHSEEESIFLPESTGAPVARIVYPANRAKIGLVDAVVVNVSGNVRPFQADLLIDGQPQLLNLKPRNGFGPLLLPLLTRDLTLGPHQIQVAVTDNAGTITQSLRISVTVAGRDEPAANAYSRAVFLLNRFGYGPEPGELAAVLTQGPHAWLEARLNETIESPLEENEREGLGAQYPDINAVVARAAGYLITDANPVRARFLVWTENHFSTWLSKDGPAEKAREHDRFLELGVAPFPDLLLASATSPAMLIYLDQRNSVVHRLNENYAREIMELHTLGVKGGYTQLDVTTLADLLTGWTLADEAPLDGSPTLARTFRYDPYLNSGSSCRILGMEFPGVPLERRFDRVLTALNLLAAHPSCAQFISRKLVEHYVSDPAPPDLVQDLARTYMETGGDLRVMLLALVDKPAFWAAPARVASPIDFGVRLARLSRLTNPGPVADLAARSGMGLFDRATPDGYPDTDGYFASSNALLQRWHFAQTVQASFLANGLIPDAWKPADNRWDAATTQKLLDLAAVRITGNVLGNGSNQAAAKLIAAAPANTAARLQLMTTFLCQIPETSLR
jgi:uncharacterized protein (DUF1800 family)